jgi:iron complex transport system substrate-binding protein
MNGLMELRHSAFPSRCCAIVAVFVTAMAQAAAAAPVQVRDASGRAVSINDASRIVSIGGAVTEILYALGLESRIVAVDSTSVFPMEALKQKPNVGYMRQLSPEGVLGLAPSLVLAAEGAGPKEAVTVIEASKTPLVSVPDHFTGDGILHKIRLIAAATGQDTKGECLAAATKADLDAVAALRARVRTNVEKPQRVLFLLSFMNSRPMVSGRNTAADGIIALAGGVNAVSEFEGYKIVGEEAIVAAKPDVVLVMQRPDLALGSTEVFSNAAFRLTPAASHNGLVAMDGLYLLGFGPRTARAARDLGVALYPSLGAQALPSEQAKACSG